MDLHFPRYRWALSFAWAAIVIPLFPAIAGGSEPSFESPFGAGLMSGRSGPDESTASVSIVLEGQNHFKQRRGLGGFRQYGHAQARAEVGTPGAGLRLSATPGFTVVGLPAAGGRFAPHVGIEPMGGRIALSSGSEWARYYEWLPAITVGAQFGLGGGCRMLPLLRTGAGIGNLGRAQGSEWTWGPSAKLALGAGAYLNCPRWDVAVEFTHLDGAAKNINLLTTDLAYALRSTGPLKLGLRAESELGRGGNSASTPDLTEQRLLVLLRSELGT